jgi:hypothetical protein
MRIKSPLHQVSTPRRRFVQGVIAGGVLAAFPSVLHAATLSYFNDDRDFSIINILKESAGGTECFSKNIVNHINFKDLIIYALNNYRAIKESSNIYNKSLTTTPKKRLLEYVEKYARA